MIYALSIYRLIFFIKESVPMYNSRKIPLNNGLAALASFFEDGKGLNFFLNVKLLRYRFVMNTEKTKKDRINELRNKIYYAETARDNYKEKHAILYETNSLYVDVLKQELSGLECMEVA
jgi:hypothetical protein